MQGVDFNEQNVSYSPTSAREVPGVVGFVIRMKLASDARSATLILFVSAVTILLISAAIIFVFSDRVPSKSTVISPPVVY